MDSCLQVLHDTHYSYDIGIPLKILLTFSQNFNFKDNDMMYNCRVGYYRKFGAIYLVGVGAEADAAIQWKLKNGVHSPSSTATT